MRTTFALVALATLGLTACDMTATSSTETPTATSSSDTPPPTDGGASTGAVELSGVDLNGDISVLGTEPFWAVGFEGPAMNYSGLDRPEQRAPRPAPVVTETTATWTTTTEAGNALVVTLSDADCSDGMSDRSYPLEAVVQIGDETLHGCAASTAWLHSTDETGAPSDG